MQAFHIARLRMRMWDAAGLVFFVVNLIFAGWIKFSPNISAPACTTVILALALIYLSITHGRWVKHIFGRTHLSEVSCLRCWIRAGLLISLQYFADCAICL